MARSVQRFEDLIAWQREVDLAGAAHRVGLLDEKTFAEFVAETDSVSRIIGNLRATFARNHRAQHA